MVSNRNVIGIAVMLLIGLAAFSFWTRKATESDVGPLAIESAQEFDQYIKSATQPTVVQFHSSCPVCLKTGLVIRKTASQHPEVSLIEVDINSVQELAQRYEIASLPTVIIFAPGNMEPQENAYTYRTKIGFESTLLRPNPVKLFQ